MNDLDNQSSSVQGDISPIVQNDMLSADIVLPPSVNGRDRFILIEKKSPETINPLVKREVSVEAVIEVIDRNFSYPMAAHVGLKFDSRTFSNIPSKKFDVKMKKVKVPSNYYPTGGNGLDRRYVYPNPDYDADPNTLDVIFMVDQNMDFATRALLKRNLKDIISKLISGYKYTRASIWQTSTTGNITIKKPDDTIEQVINNFIYYPEDDSNQGAFFEVETPDSDGTSSTNLYKKLFNALSSTQISTNPDETIIANYFLRKTQFGITDTVGTSSETATLRHVWENTVRKIIYFSGSTPETMTQNTYDTLLSHARENCVSVYYFHNDSDFSGTRTLRELAEDTGGAKFCMLHDSDVKLTQFCDNNFYDSNKIYYGDWDGTFKIAWTDNPAWVLYDIITDPNYGLGNYIDSKAVDKWTLYDIGRYCDCVDDDGRFRGVPDGKGGLEPRYTCNIIFYNKDEAYNVLKDISAVFKGILYWTTEGFSFFADMPKQAVMQFANSSVKDGVFNYEDTAKNLRYTSVEVTYNDRYDFYKPKVEYVEDSEGIIKYGLNPFKVNAAGCTSRSEAKRIGRYVMSTSMHESEVVTFTAGIEGSYLQIGDLFMVSDEIKNVARTFGRILDVDSANKTIKIDGEFQEGLASGIFVHIPSGNYKVSDLNRLNDSDGNFTGTLENIRARRQSQLKQLNIKQVQDDTYGCTLTVTGNFLMDSVITDVHLEEGRYSGAVTTGDSVLTGIVYTFPENTVVDGNPTWDTLSYQQVTGVFNEVGLDVDLIGEAGTGQLIAPVANNWLGKIDYKLNGSNSFFYTNGSAQVEVNTNAIAIAEISATDGSRVNSGTVSNLDDVWSSSVYTSATTGNVIAIFSRGTVISNSYAASNANWKNLAATEVFKIGKNISATSTSFGYAAAFIKGGYRIIERASKNLSDQGSLTFYYRDLLALSKLRPYYTISQADIGNNQATNLKDWTFDFPYKVGDRVKNNGNVYLCVQDHKSPATFEVGNKWTNGNSLGYSTYGFPKNFYVRQNGQKIPITTELTADHITGTFISLGINKIYRGDGPLGESNLATLSESQGLGYSGLIYGTGYPIGYYNLNVDTSARHLDLLSAGSSYVLSGSGVEPKYYKTIATKEEEANQYNIVGLQYMPDKESFVEREIADNSPSQYVASPYDKIIKPDPVSAITNTGIYGGTGLDVTWQQVTTTPINGYKIYVSRPDYSNSNDSALTEFFAVPSGTNKVTIPINEKWGQYDIDIYSQGITPYKFLSDGAASIAIQVLPEPTLQIDGTTVNSVLVSGIKLDTADVDSLKYNIGYKSSASCFTGVGAGNFTSADLTFRWKYIDPTGGIVSNVDQMRRNPFIEFPPKVTLEIINEGGAVLETVKQYQGFSYRIDENANKKLVSREQTNYQNVQASRNLGLRIKVEDTNNRSFTGVYQATNIPPSYKEIEVIDSYQNSPYQILSGIYGNQSYQRLAVWNSGTNNIVSGSGLRDSAGTLLRSENETDVSYGDIVSAFLSATGFNGIEEGSVPSVAGITINYRGDGDPDYEAYVNLYGDLLNFYNKSVDKSKSKEVFGLEHYTAYGQNEGRELPKTKNNPMGIADLDAVPTGKVGFSGIAMTVLPEKVSFNKIIFNCSSFSSNSNKDVYKVDIYTGSISGFIPDTLKKTNYHREYLMTDTRKFLNVIELSDESIKRSTDYYYRFLPYDDFGSGIMSAVCSGYLVNEEREGITKSYKKKTLNGNADEGNIDAADMVQDVRYKIVTLGTINWNDIGVNEDTTPEINVEFDYNGEAITGSDGVVQRIEKPEIIKPTEIDILHVFDTKSNSTVVIPEDIVEGSTLNFVNVGEHDIYVNNPDGNTANGESITVLKPKERVELFKVNGIWIDPRGDNLYLD